MNDYFICLSMLVSGRYRYESPYLNALDLLAHEIEREGEGHEISRHVVKIFLPRTYRSLGHLVIQPIDARCTCLGMPGADDCKVHSD